MSNKLIKEKSTKSRREGVLHILSEIFVPLIFAVIVLTIIVLISMVLQMHILVAGLCVPWLIYELIRKRKKETCSLQERLSKK